MLRFAGNAQRKRAHQFPKHHHRVQRLFWRMAFHILPLRISQTELGLYTASSTEAEQAEETAFVSSQELREAQLAMAKSAAALISKQIIAGLVKFLRKCPWFGFQSGWR